MSNRNQAISRPQRIQSQPQVKVEENHENDNLYSYLESEIEDLTLDEVNEMLIESPIEEKVEIKETISQGEPDLIDEILKEIENK